MHQLRWLPVQTPETCQLQSRMFRLLIFVRPGTSVLGSWFQKVQDVGSTRPLTDRALFHAHTTLLVTEALLPPGHVCGTAYQHTCATKALPVTVLGMN